MRQRADTVEDALLDQQAHNLWNRLRLDEERKAAKPKDPRKKHLAKLRRLMNGPLPRLVDLSHNGVMERAGVVRWCYADKDDGRPMPPFTTNTLVARGSFLYLFHAGGCRLITASSVADHRPLTPPNHRPIVTRSPPDHRLLINAPPHLWRRGRASPHHACPLCAVCVRRHRTAP